MLDFDNIVRVEREAHDRCWRCRETIPPQDIRTQDSEGHDVCLACGDGVKPDMKVDCTEHEFVPYCIACGKPLFYENLCGTCGDVGEAPRQCEHCGLDEAADELQ